MLTIFLMPRPIRTNTRNILNADLFSTSFRLTVDKVRYVPRGRSKYLYEPKKDKIYDVVTRESESGQVGISGHGFNDGINWYDLELVEPVAKPPYYAETGLVRRRKDGKCVVTFLYSRLSKETADRLAQMVCDKLNELEGEKA